MVQKKSCVCRPEIDLKHFDKLKPEPGPTYNSGAWTSQNMKLISTQARQDLDPSVGRKP